MLMLLRGVEPPNAFGRAVAELGCSSRRVLWSNVTHLIELRPWTGWGWGELDFAHYANLYEGPRFCDILDNAHNLPLHLAVELGLPAAGLICIGLLALTLRAKPWREADSARRLAWTVLGAIAVHSMLEYPLWYGPFQLAVVYCVFLLTRAGGAPILSRVTGFTSVALVLLLGYLAIEYDDVSQAYRSPELRKPAFRDDPIAAAGRPLFFLPQLRFAELSLAPVTAASALRVQELASTSLHSSPEPMVIEKLIDSDLLLHRFEEAQWHMRRFEAAFPQAYAEWLKKNAALAGLRGNGLAAQDVR